MMFRGIGVCLLVASLASLAWTQDEERAPGGRGGERSGGERAERRRDGIQPYDKVITKGAKSDPGLFLVHRLDDKIFYEIPKAALDGEYLWVTQISKTQSGFGYGGTGLRNRVVRWELRNEEVLLRDVKYRVRGDADEGVKYAVEGTTLEAIIMTFPIKAWGKDQAAVIDVTELFLDDVTEFSPKSRLNASGIDRKRTYLDEAKSFPENIETKVTATYRLNSQTPGRGGEGGPPRRPDSGPPRDPSQGAVTVQLHHSMVKLPEVPMQPRRKDSRVGFFDVSFEDYGTGDHQVKEIEYITRWRLEKKDPEAAVSEPKKPIVFHVGRGVPDKWRPWVRKGIESWQPAFEAAGFKNAILAKDAPTPQEDPDWDAEDARHSTIQWLPSTIENAMGPHVHDPRTGEILEADIIIYHNVLKLARDWYFVQASPMDERAQTLPMPDDLVGELLAYVVAHEVGHSLGFPHNMKASNAYTTAQLRDPEFTKQYGTEASIMDYGRFNYVAQPGDGARLIPIIGPYDFFAIEWGYREFADANDVAAERKKLEEIVARQIDDPKLRFGDPNASVDPTQQTEDLGSDAIEATTLGLENLRRVASFLVKATCKPGEDYSLLRNMYDELIQQRNRELMHVANVVGGVVETNLWYGQADGRFKLLDPTRQREAIAFLSRHSFQVPQELVDESILTRLEANGAPDRIVQAQKRILGSLINEDRVKRMAEHHERDPKGSYAPLDMIADVRAGIWGELGEAQPSVDLYRRNLQRAHVETLAAFVGKDRPASELTAISRGELVWIRDAIAARSANAADEVTRLHLDDLKARIGQVLDAKSETEKSSDAPAGAP